MHLHVSPTTRDDLGAEVERLLSLGATRLDAGHEDACGVPLADPDGNEFCVLEPREGPRRLRR